LIEHPTDVRRRDAPFSGFHRFIPRRGPSFMLGHGHTEVNRTFGPMAFELQVV
jgi:hypothetical protein